MEDYLKWAIIILSAILVERLGERIFSREKASPRANMLVAILIAGIAGALIPYLVNGLNFILFLEAMILGVLITVLFRIRKSTKKPFDK